MAIYATLIIILNLFHHYIFGKSMQYCFLCFKPHLLTLFQIIQKKFYRRCDLTHILRINQQAINFIINKFWTRRSICIYKRLTTSHNFHCGQTKILKIARNSTK
ncbi:hypothetical protein AL1_18520 [Alistipes shahii WAL 8301]|uniref:Uncharacterized protein n=1 Tax=Alistipes shahii WAL 8301 TaxID=717959 RepID=D4IMQ6_9BACT|nr:hypothetical protein AL1_18520 [Alistipes shahii WAL 8301]